MDVRLFGDFELKFTPIDKQRKKEINRIWHKYVPGLVSGRGFRALSP